MFIMKSLSFVALVVLLASTGCASVLPQHPYLPKGATACTNDYQCPSNSYCGFAGVDQYASCRYVGPESTASLSLR